MMFVAGIDYSTTYVDICLLEEETDAAKHYRSRLEGDTPFDRARSVSYMLPRGTWWDDVYLAGLETSFSRSHQTVVGLARVQGAIAASISPRVTVLETPGYEWTRLFLGGTVPKDRKQRKAAIKRRALELGFGDEAMPQDGFDAYGIAWAVRALNRAAVERVA